MGAYQNMLTKIWGGYLDLSLYELMFKANNALLKNEEIKTVDREYIIKRFLDGVSTEYVVKSFHKGVHAPSKENGDTREMYPLFYIPPYNAGKKLVTLSTITPKTHILSANAYELEILGLLAVFARGNQQINYMLERTKSRLKNTCFGKFCSMGECFESSIVVLRFLARAFPEEILWMKKLIAGIKTHLFDKKRHSGVFFYYWLTLSELPLEVAKDEIERFSINCDQNTQRFALQKLLHKSFVLNSDHDKYASPFGTFVLRNCLARLEDFAFIKDLKPYVCEKDGRLHLDF